MNKITAPTKLLDDEGNLLAPGYATEMLYEYDRREIKANSLRIKEWDYYLIYNQNYAIALTISDNSYMGLLSASVIDFKNKTEHTTSPMSFMPNGRTNFPSTSKTGDVCVKNKRCWFEFKNDNGKRVLKAEMKNFDGDKTFYAEFALSDEPQDSMVIATPFEKKNHFYLNQKIVGFRAKGFAQVGEENYNFEPSDTFAILDWGRGVWTYKNTWYWSSACGVLDGEVFGFNFGYGFGDTSKATENMLFYKGKAHKLDNVTFEIPQENKKLEFLKPWKVVSSDNRVNLTFEPILDRNSNANVLVICSIQHQVFGKFSGTVVLDDGTKLVLKNFLGFAEKVDNRW